MPNIVSADARLAQRLEKGNFSASVHSVFPHAVNIVWSTVWSGASSSIPDGLFFLVHAGGDNGPGALVTDIPDFRALALEQGMPVRVGKGVLQVGGSRFSHFGARAWEAPAFFTGAGLAAQLLGRNLTAVQARAAKAHAKNEKSPLARLGALLKAFPQVDSDKVSRVDSLLTGRTRAMISALRQGDTARALDCAAGLLGLGQGLTPSGDDILLGFLAACAVNTRSEDPVENLAENPTENPTENPKEARERGCQGQLASFRCGVLDKAKTATHILSWAGIAEAAHGRMRSSLSSFIQAMLTGTRADTERTLAALLAIGACSGADLAYGILCGLDFSGTEKGLL